MSIEQPLASDPPPDYLSLSDDRLRADCTIETFRASGPGGQHRNKTDSAVRLTHRPTGIVVQAFESRSQHDNRVHALAGLRVAIALDVRRPVDATNFTPSAALEAILPRSRQQVRAANPRFWAGAQELLDVFVACGCAVAATAKIVGLSSGALSRLLLSDDPLAARVNSLRAERGLRALR